MVDLVIYLVLLACVGAVFWGIGMASYAVFANRPVIDGSGTTLGVGVALGAVFVMHLLSKWMSDAIGD